MIIKLNTTSNIPIYVQLRNEIVLGIGRGELKIGENLPTVRQLAEDIGINMMTVTKTYTILKNEGYIEIDRRHGAKVKPIPLNNEVFQEKMEEDLQLLITESSLKGIEKKEFLDKCEKLFEELNISNLVGQS